MKKLTASQADSLLFTIACIIITLFFISMKKYAVDINPKDIEYIGTLSLGVIGFGIASVVYLVKTIKAFK